MSAQCPAINGVVESILYTDDLASAIAFYRDVLGLAPMKGDGERFQAFDSGAQRVLLLFKRGGTLTPQPVPSGGTIPPHDGRGPHHIAFAIHRADYDAWTARLQHHGIAIESETTWERGGRSLYFRDRDNHLVEFSGDTPFDVYPTRACQRRQAHQPQVSLACRRRRLRRIRSPCVDSGRLAAMD